MKCVRVSGVGLRVYVIDQGLGLRVQGLGFRFKVE